MEDYHRAVPRTHLVHGSAAVPVRVVQRPPWSMLYSWDHSFQLAREEITCVHHAWALQLYNDSHDQTGYTSPPNKAEVRACLCLGQSLLCV